jgi:hypothetical protein
MHLTRAGILRYSLRSLDYGYRKSLREQAQHVLEISAIPIDKDGYCAPAQAIVRGPSANGKAAEVAATRSFAPRRRDHPNAGTRLTVVLVVPGGVPKQRQQKMRERRCRRAADDGAHRRRRVARPHPGARNRQTVSAARYAGVNIWLMSSARILTRLSPAPTPTAGWSRRPKPWSTRTTTSTGLTTLTGLRHANQAENANRTPPSQPGRQR